MANLNPTAKVAIVKRKSRRIYLKKALECCAVCGKLGKYNYYNVHSCEACKQFFRRVVLVACDYVCKKLGRCDPSRDHCRSCRLDKCLLVGMDPNLVVTTNAREDSRQIIEKLLERKLALSEGKEGRSQVVPASITFPESAGADHLLQVVNRHRRFWANGMDFSLEYLNRHESLADLLGDQNNLLGRAEQFLDRPPVKQFIWEVKLYQGPFAIFAKCMKTSYHDILLAIEFAKTVPLFQSLQFNEQVAILDRTLLPAIMLFCVFYSAELGADEWQTVDGYKTTDPFKKRFSDDPKIVHFCKKMFCDTVDAVKEAQIGREELALLLAIILTNTDSAVSQPTLVLLYKESAHHAKQLLQLLQTKHGQVAGTKRFVRAMDLVNMAFKHEYDYKALLTYLEAFYMKCERRKLKICPKALESIWSQY